MPRSLISFFLFLCRCNEDIVKVTREGIVGGGARAGIAFRGAQPFRCSRQRRHKKMQKNEAIKTENAYLGRGFSRCTLLRLLLLASLRVLLRHGAGRGVGLRGLPGDGGRLGRLGKHRNLVAQLGLASPRLSRGLSRLAGAPLLVALLVVLGNLVPVSGWEGEKREVEGMRKRGEKEEEEMQLSLSVSSKTRARSSSLFLALT